MNRYEKRCNKGDIDTEITVRMEDEHANVKKRTEKHEDF